jgi:pilus assembly protein TadC
MITALLLVTLGLAAVPLPGGDSRDRLAAVLPPAARPAGGSRWNRLRSHLWLGGGAVAGLAVAVFLGGAAGVLAGAGSGLVAAWLLRRLEPAAVRRAGALRAADLPGCLDLLVCALSAGMPLPTALIAVASASDGPLAPDLARIGRLAALGAGPATAWADHGGDPVLGRVARVAQRSADSGSALADALTRLAEDMRAEAAARAESAAHRAGVLAMAPLGLCFLPAFVCLGVAPVVIGIASQVLP